MEDEMQLKKYACYFVPLILSTLEAQTHMQQTSILLSVTTVTFNSQTLSAHKHSLLSVLLHQPQNKYPKTVI